MTALEMFANLLLLQQVSTKLKLKSQPKFQPTGQKKPVV